MNALPPPPQPVITIQCDTKPECKGIRLIPQCPAGYHPSTSPITIKWAEIDYYRKIHDMITSSCIKNQVKNIRTK
jgi:hypothetical protein